MSLSLNNLCIGNVLVEINSCHSTNNVAKQLLSKSKPIEGTVVLTDKQTDGKGQIGNKWQSEPYQNLTFSIILKPTFLKPELQFMLSKIVSIACVDTFTFFTQRKFHIKWPNDIYIENEKVTGILIENIISGKQLSNSILGIGMNINQKVFADLPKATSLTNVLNHKIDKEKLLQYFLKKMDQLYLKLRNGKFKEIDKVYHENLFGLEKERIFIEKGILFKAKVKGVNEIGQLILEKENEELSFYNMKEVVWKF